MARSPFASQHNRRKQGGQFVTHHGRKCWFALALLVCSACSPLPPAPIPPAPPGPALAAVFDIDGTLTPRVSAIHTARPDAARAAHALADKGYAIFYVSTRRTWLSSGIPEFLRKNGFPAGTVEVAQNRADINDPAGFKSRKLAEIKDQGWHIVLAYGDSSTDFKAYADSGVPKDDVYALRRQGKQECQSGAFMKCLGGWSEHLGFLEALPPLAPAH